eukprot:COSAG02_NODE_17211_length_1021_cov_0.845987_2_plen_45_part_01
MATAISPPPEAAYVIPLPHEITMHSHRHAARGVRVLALGDAATGA